MKKAIILLIVLSTVLLTSCGSAREGCWQSDGKHLKMK